MDKRIYKREYARKWRARLKSNAEEYTKFRISERIRNQDYYLRIKADAEKYAKWLEKNRKWQAISRARRTPKQKERIRLQNLEWRRKNRERDNQNKINHRRKLRQTIIQAYGGKCACCGEDRIEFLSIDHIGGGGNKHRKSLGRTGYHFYYWLKRNNYPKGFRVLCHNCNQSLGHYGYCPHQLSKN